MYNVLRYGSLGLAATILITACAPAMTTPPADGPGMNGPQAPALGEALADGAVPAFPSDVTPLPTAPSAPQPPLSVNDQGLVLPTGGNVTLDQLYEDLPPSIPQDEASEWLSPMPGAIPQGFGQPLPGGIGPEAFGPMGYGAYPGIIPELLSYNALARCLYFRYLNFWIPYYLIGNAYYPYAYSPYYDARLSGLYAYPLFYDYDDYCYPYYFLSSRYRYGYLDWEYNWPGYRSKYRHSYDDDYRRYRSRWGSREFNGWLDNRRRDGKHANWRERAREYRRGNRPDHHQGNRPGNSHGNRPDWNNGPGHSPGKGPDRGSRPDRHDRNDRNDRQDRHDRNDRQDRHDRNDRKEHPGRHDRGDRPNYQQGNRHDRGSAGGEVQRPSRGQGGEHGPRQGNGRPHRSGDDDGRGRSARGGEHAERGPVASRPARSDHGGGEQVRRGGQQQARQHEGRGQHQARQNSSRGGQQQARQNGSRGGQQGRHQGGRVRPAGTETPEEE